MASGNMHDRSILFTSPVVLVVGASYAGFELGVVLGASYFLGGWLLWEAAEILQQAIRNSKSRAREVKKLRDSVKPVVKLLKP